MNVRKLMDFVSGEANFKILRLLHEKPMYAGELGQRLSADDRAIRVHLHNLRKRDFVEYEKNGRKHLYSIKAPFASPAHELLISMVAISDPVRKPGENASPIPGSDFETGAKKSHIDYLKELLDSYIENFVMAGSVNEGRKLGESLKKLTNRIEDLDRE